MNRTSRHHTTHQTKPSQVTHLVARRVFLTTYLAMLLTSALFAAPLLATHPDFAHEHPDNTPEHVHPLTTVLGHTAVSAVIDVVPVSLPFVGLLVLPALLYTGILTPQTLRCRSPPACVLSPLLTTI
ncbi:MAG: hypothetical protein AAF708_04730 [Deinococcota bacterium]